MGLNYQIRKCQREGCSLRYPVFESDHPSDGCPRCGGSTVLLYEGWIERENHSVSPRRGIQVEAILDNVRSAWNVGSMFRSADAIGLKHLYLCGITSTPENPRVAKTALGAERIMPWSYHADGVELACDLKAQGVNLWALENQVEATEIFPGGYDLHERRTILIVGNEISGVDPGLLEICDQVLRVPMRGVKRSLNAAVAFGIAAFMICMQTR